MRQKRDNVTDRRRVRETETEKRRDRKTCTKRMTQIGEKSEILTDRKRHSDRRR